MAGPATRGLADPARPPSRSYPYQCHPDLLVAWQPTRQLHLPRRSGHSTLHQPVVQRHPIHQPTDPDLHPPRRLSTRNKPHSALSSPRPRQRRPSPYRRHPTLEPGRTLRRVGRGRSSPRSKPLDRPLARHHRNHLRTHRHHQHPGLDSPLHHHRRRNLRRRISPPARPGLSSLRRPTPAHRVSASTYGFIPSLFSFPRIT